MDENNKYQGSPNQTNKSESNQQTSQQDSNSQQQQPQQQYIPTYQINDQQNNMGQQMQGQDNRFHSSQINHSKYKTQKCRHFENNGHCVMGDKCNFAHGDSELKEMQPQGGNNNQGFSSGRGGGSRRGGASGPMRYQNQGFQNNRQQMGYFQQDFSSGGNQGDDGGQNNQYDSQTPQNQYMSSPSQQPQDPQNSRGGMYQGGRGGRGNDQNNRGNDQNSRGNDYNSRGGDLNGRGGGNNYMRMNRRGGYQSNDRGGMGGQMGNSSPNYYNGSTQGQGNYSRSPMQQDGQNKPFVPPQSRGNYKTELCKYFSQGNCPYTSRCSFAHGQQELKDKPVFSGQGQQQNSGYYQGNSGQYGGNGGGGYSNQGSNFGRQHQNQNQMPMMPMHNQGGFQGVHQQHQHQQQQYSNQQSHYYQSMMNQQMPMFMNQMGQNQNQMPGQMQQMWQPQQQQQMEPAPNRRIHIKQKDSQGQMTTVRAIAVYLSPNGIGNQQVMQQLLQADMYAEQGEAQKVEQILMQLQMNNLILYRSPEQQTAQQATGVVKDAGSNEGGETKTPPTASK